MNFQGHLESAYRLVRDQPLLFILGGLLLQVLVVMTLGVLAGPLLGAYVLAAILVFRDKKVVSLNDFFAGLSRFGSLFPYLALLVLIFLGVICLVVPGILFAVWWLYTLPLMADRQLSLGEAMRQSRAKVLEKGFFMHLVFLFMITVVPDLLISFLSTMLPILQIFFVLIPPLQAGCIASLYLEQFEGLDPGSRLSGQAELPSS